MIAFCVPQINNNIINNISSSKGPQIQDFYYNLSFHPSSRFISRISRYIFKLEGNAAWRFHCISMTKKDFLAIEHSVLWKWHQIVCCVHHITDYKTGCKGTYNEKIWELTLHLQYRDHHSLTWKIHPIRV